MGHSHVDFAVHNACCLLTDWEKIVHENLELLSKTPSDTLWPKDTLFKYFQLMESLQENLQERDDLQELARKYKVINM